MNSNGNYLIIYVIVIGSSENEELKGFSES